MTSENPTTNSILNEQLPGKTALPIAEGMVNVVMSAQDLETLANLMSACAKTFEGLAMNAAELNNEKDFSVYQARQRLSSIFAERFVATVSMPEPISRDYH